MCPHVRWRRVAPVAALIVLSAPPVRAQSPAGPEFRVNTQTTAHQIRQALATDANGDFVVVWQADNQDGGLDAIIGRRFTGAGVPVGPEFQVNTWTTNEQRSPAVASGPAGQFVVVWESFLQDGDLSGIFGQRFDALGTPLGGEFRVSLYTTGNQSEPRVAMDAGGNFVVAWSSDGKDGALRAVLFQRYAADGSRQGSETVANVFTFGNQFRPAVAFDPAGDFVVTWSGGVAQDGNAYGVFARRFDGSGTALGGEFRVNSYTTGNQTDPDVAHDRNGNFVVVWTSAGGDGDGYVVAGQRFNPAGVPLGGEFMVNAWTTDDQSYPMVTVMEDDGFIVVWRSRDQDGDDFGVYGRRFSPAGLPTGTEVKVNTYTTGRQRYPTAAANPDGDLVVSWSSEGQDGSGYGVYAQRYGDLIFQDNFESDGLSRWSAANSDGFDLDTSGSAGLAGTDVGLLAFVDDTNALFVQDDTPNAENRYRARFYLDPNGFDPGESVDKRRVRVFIAFNGSSQRLVTLVLRRLSGAYSLMARVRHDDGSRSDTPFFSITDAPHVVEFDWRRSTSPAASNGSLQLYLDNVSVATLSGLDNDGSPVEFARLGVMTIKTAAASGMVRLDQFESRRLNPIGPE